MDTELPKNLGKDIREYLLNSCVPPMDEEDVEEILIQIDTEYAENLREMNWRLMSLPKEYWPELREIAIRKAEKWAWIVAKRWGNEPDYPDSIPIPPKGTPKYWKWLALETGMVPPGDRGAVTRELWMMEDNEEESLDDMIQRISNEVRDAEAEEEERWNE